MIVGLGQTTNLASIFAGISLGFSQIRLASVFSDITPDDIHEAINYALGTLRVMVTPTGDPWKVSQKMFDRMIDLALQKLKEIDPASAGAVGRHDMGVYIIARGYISSAPPPEEIRAALPSPIKDVPDVVLPVPTIIIDPTLYIPAIRRMDIKPLPEPLYDPDAFSQREPAIIEPPQDQYIGPPPSQYVGPPEDYPPIPDPGIAPTYDTIPGKSEQDTDYTSILWIVGAIVGGVVLAGMVRPSGRPNYERR